MAKVSHAKRSLFPGLEGLFSPEEAEAAIALAEANPIPPRPFMNGWQAPSLNKSGFHIEGVHIDSQKEKPEAPEVRQYSTSSYDRTIAISLGRRRLGGNVIQCSALVPRLVGTREYFVEYQIPIYEDPVTPPDGPTGIDATIECRNFLY